VLGYPPAHIQSMKIEDLIPGFYDEFDVPSCDRYLVNIILLILTVVR
jgi:hypothetical protein